MRIILRMMVAALAGYLLLAAGLIIVYVGWLPGADALLAGRHVHSCGHYLALFSLNYARAIGWLLLAAAGIMGFRAWVRATGGWRRFLPRFIFLVLFTALLAELALRLIFSLPGGRLPGLQNAEWLGDPNTDDAYWVLAARLAGRVERDYVVPGRGWSQTRPDAQNPMGLREEARRALSEAGPKIFFFGDSFVQGMPFNQQSLPSMLDERLADRVVVNLGVRGYGIDQMLMLARELGLPAEGDEVWVGLLTWDLDRVYLSYIYGQKPRYRLVGKSLVLEREPGRQTDQEFVDAYRIPFRSWLAQAARRRWQMREGLERGGPERDEKIALNRVILGEWASWCQEQSIPMRVVLFHTRQDLAQDSWRTRAIHDICHELHVPLYDTADVLLPFIQERGTWGEELYQQGDFHHTDLANRVIADWLVAHWFAREL